MREILEVTFRFEYVLASGNAAAYFMASASAASPRGKGKSLQPGICLMNVMLGHSAAPVAVIVFDVSKLAESLRISILYRQQRHVRKICFFRFVGKLYADAFQHYL